MGHISTVLMLRLHYVPGGHGSPVCPKRSAPWDFWSLVSLFSRFVEFSHGLPRYPWRVVGYGLLVPEAQRARYGSARGLLRMPVRSLPVRHVLIGSLTFLTFWSRSDTFFTFCQGFLRMKRGHRAALEHVCAHDMKRRHPKQDSAEGSQWWAPSHPPKSWWRPRGCPSLSRCVFFSLLMQPQVQVPVRLPGQQQQLPWSTLTLNLTLILP